jgi:spermidine synthase
LGTGALAAYARPGEHWTFFEIDPAVARVARDLGYFTYLSTCEGEWDIDLGDARRRLEARSDTFDVLILDAFSSDAIPVHLLTREAMGLYLDRLAPQGVIAFHVSNRYLDLPPLLERLAAERGMAVRVDSDGASDTQAAEGKAPSIWVALARDEAALAVIKKDVRWQKIKPRPGPVWTDRFSNLLAVWKRDEP